MSHGAPGGSVQGLRGSRSLSAVTQTDEIVRLVRDVLGPDLVGAYLHGSAVFGGLKPRSDIDVLAVSTRTLAVGERRILVERLMRISGRHSPGGRPVELTIVVQADVRPWRYPPRADLQYGEWLRRDFEAGELPMPAPSPDLALLITMVLGCGRPLLGPPPGEVFDPVPPADLRRAALAGMPGLRADLATDTRNVILTFARIWTTVATGTIRTKDAAADWALVRLPVEHRAVLERARAGYLGQEDDPWDDLLPQVRAHLDYVIGEIERTSRQGG